MSKKVVDTPIYVDTYKLVGILYNDKKNCFALRARYGFRAVLRRKYKVRL